MFYRSGWGWRYISFAVYLSTSYQVWEGWQKYFLWSFKVVKVEWFGPENELEERAFKKAKREGEKPPLSLDLMAVQMIEKIMSMAAVTNDNHFKDMLIRRLEEDINSKDSTKVVHGLLVMIKFIDWIGSIKDHSSLLIAIKHHLGDIDAKDAALIRKQCRYLLLHAARSVSR